MTARQCPNCSFQVLPGVVNCRRCGYDFILGGMPGSKGSARQKTPNARLVVAGATALAISLGLILFAVLREEPEDLNVQSHPCELALTEIVSLISAAETRGNSITECSETPPASANCWLPAGVPASALKPETGLRFRLTVVASDFQVECLTDEDEDGIPVVYRGNAEVPAVRLSQASIR